MSSKRKKANRARHSTPSERNANEETSGGEGSPKVEAASEYLLNRLTEEQSDSMENQRIWRFFRDAPGWLTSIILVIVTACQMLAAAQGNVDTAIAIASAVDTTRLMKVAGLGIAAFLVATLPVMFFIYFRHELAVRYRDLTIAAAVGPPLHDDRILNRRIQGGIHWLLMFVAVSVWAGPASLSAPSLVFLLLGAISAFQSPFRPSRFLDTLNREGRMRLDKDSLRSLIYKRVEVSNLRRANGSAVLVVVLLAASFALFPGAMLPYQQVNMKDRSVLVGSVLGSTPTGTSVLQDNPRRVVLIKSDQVVSAQQCANTDMANQKSIFRYISEGGGGSPVEAPCGVSTGRFSSAIAK